MVRIKWFGRLIEKTILIVLKTSCRHLTKQVLYVNIYRYNLEKIL